MAVDPVKATPLILAAESGSAEAADRLLATRLGTACATMIQEGVGGVMVAARIVCLLPIAVPVLVGLLLSAAYAFFFVLLPYLAAYINFHLAWALSLLVIGGRCRLASACT